MTGLRFVAALHVVLFHVLGAYGGHGEGALGNVLRAGYVGVSLFFVLSGFVLAWTYAPRLDRAPLDRGAFWWARLARVYPVYALALLAELPGFLQRSAAEGAVGRLSSGFLTATLAQAWDPPSACDWNCPGWSLSAEAFFYALFPALLAAAHAWAGRGAVRSAPGLRRARRALALAALACAAAALVLPLVYLALDPDHLRHAASAASGGRWLAALKMLPPVRLPEFALGVVAGLWFVRERQAAPAGALPRWIGWGGAIGGLVALAALAASPRLPYPLLHDGLLALPFAALVAGLAAGRGPLARLLATPPMRLLGEASYAVYLLHIPVRLGMQRWGVDRWVRAAARDAGLRGAGDAVALAAYLAVTLALSLVVYRWVEEPARRAMRRWWDARRAAAAPARAPALGARRAA